MLRSLPLPLHTSYAELVERGWLARLAEDFPANGHFYRQEHKGRGYWYFRQPDGTGRRKQRYVGPDNDDLRRQIEKHRDTKADFRERRTMVQALLAAGLPAPEPLTGRLIEALADAGVFRLRAVLVGTVAFQTYGGLIGKVFPGASNQTADLDLAQFADLSVAIDDQIDLPLLEILQKVDPRFQPVPRLKRGQGSTSYSAGDRYRVDLLAPNRGPERDAPLDLKALKSSAQPMRFLDFLIYREVKAIVLFGGGIPVNVPAPERYALHKLIVSRRRHATADSQAKARKDLLQAELLLEVLLEQRPYELRDAWAELLDRGPTWRQLAQEGLGLVKPEVRSRFEQMIVTVA
jgi:hypothetical protein